MRRNIGIDCLRVISMFMVVLLHVQGFADLINSVEVFSVKYELLRLLDVLSLCAVNCFAIISGMVMYKDEKRRLNFKRLAEFWGQTLFYSVFNAVFFFLLFQEKEGILSVLFPILTGKYWYITAYIGVFFLVPFLNAAVSKLDKKLLEKGLATILVVYSILPMFFHQDPFKLEAGYSTLWLLILYLIGACIKKYDVACKVKKSILLYLGVSVITWGGFLIEVLTANVLGTPKGYSYLMNYTCPLMVAQSIFLRIALKNLNTSRWRMCTKGIEFVAPLTLGIYMFHLRSPMWDILTTKGIHRLAGQNIIVFTLCIIALAIGIFVIGAVVEWTRQLVYELLHINIL